MTSKYSSAKGNIVNFIALCVCLHKPLTWVGRIANSALLKLCLLPRHVSHVIPRLRFRAFRLGPFRLDWWHRLYHQAPRDSSGQWAPLLALSRVAKLMASW